MKKLSLILVCVLVGLCSVQAQDIAESQVPSVVLNNFKKEFPKAGDVEWELKGTQYKVEFEIGLADHDAWFEAGGQMVKHVEEIATGDLPTSVTAAIHKNYESFRASDAKKITTGTQVTYELELDNGSTEWKILFSNTGAELSKVSD